MISLEEQLGLAIHLAAASHLGQFDKGGNPYILHCMKVMHYLKDDDIRLKISAVLHDIVEDTSVTLQDLRDLGINDYSVDIVERLTKVSNQSPEEYLQGILMSYGACVVKMADLRHNSDIRRLKGLTEKDFKRMAKYHTMYKAISLRVEEFKLNRAEL